MERAARAALLALALSTLAAASARAAAATDDVAAAEALVSQVWFEGLPVDRAETLGDAAGDFLAALLLDPTRSDRHANAVLALGACACGPAFTALADYDAAAAAATGELETARYRAWQQIPAAMGLLARGDDRALAWLETRAGRVAAPTRARHRHHDGARIARLRREAAVRGLGASGRARAESALARIEAEADAAGDARLRDEAATARDACRHAAARGGAR
ncbi:MAG: hypothetical protein R3E88_02775 [Myxococcota bacterium]